MATLINTRKEWLQEGKEPFIQYLDRMDKILEGIFKNERRSIIMFPVADGHAYYYIKSETPLKLEHIPVGDNWEVGYATIRGLRISDLENHRCF